MNAPPTSSTTLHPVLWIAGIAVTLLSVVGIASLTGLLPSRPAAPTESIAAVAPTPAPTAPPTSAPVATPAATAASASAAPAPAIAHRQPTKHKSSTAAALPPPAGAGVPPDYAPPPAALAPSAPPCANCGIVANIREVTHEGTGSGLGAVAGGLLGGAVANNIGQGNGRTLATIAGLVGGGLLGNQIEKSQHKTVSYEISVRMDDGTNQLIDTGAMPSWRIGDPVKVLNGSLVAR